jgi:hypothetical protein
VTIGRWTVQRQDVLIGVIAALGVIGFVIAAASMHDIGFPLDDAWIHQTYARNLAERGEWAFVPGEASVASTSPLYTVLLAVGYVLTIDFFAWAFVLGAVALAAAGWIGRRMALVLYPGMPGVGVWTGLALVTTWHLLWAAAAGMETMLFGTLSLLIVWLLWRGLDYEQDRETTRSPRALFTQGAVIGIVGALLTLTRPEGVGLVGLVGLFALLAWPHGYDRAGLVRYAAWGGGVALGCLIGVAPYLALNLHIEGTLLPNTSAAKQAEYASARDTFILLRYLRLLLQIFVGAQFLLLPGMVLGVHNVIQRARSDRRKSVLLLPLVWACVDLSAYALRLPVTYQHGRYVMPVLPHLMLYGVGGTFLLLRAGRRSTGQRILTRTLALAAVGLVPGFFVIGARGYGADVRIINTEMVDTAQWVAENIPPDELLAVHDIGALGYYAPRPILGLAGLVSPEVVPIINDNAALMHLMCERGVRYLVVLPDQLPVPKDDARLGSDPVFVTDAPYAPAASGKPDNNMAVYALQWLATCQ